MENITAAKEKFGALIEAQKKRVAAMRAQGDFVDYAALPQIVIGVCGGDGIGPTITHEAERVLRFPAERRGGKRARWRSRRSTA